MQNRTPDGQVLSESAMLASFAEHSIGVPLFFFESTDSTNTRALQLLREGAEPPFAVLAKSQSSGRGRFDRKWVDESGKSILLTVALPVCGASNADWGAFCPACAACICGDLRAYSGADLMLKWPNDIYIGGKKLSGMIAEAISKDGKLKSVILGVGLNFMKPLSMDEKLASSVCDIFSNSSKPINICDCCSVMLGAILRAHERICNADLAFLKPEFERFDLLKGLSISVNNFNSIVSGVADGIDASGNLILKTEGGICLCRAGEASIIKGFLK